MSIIGFIILTALGFASRLLPHPANFTMIGAIALFAPAVIPGKRGFFAGAAALFLSDIFIGFYDARLMAVVYASVLIAGFIGRWIARDVSAARVAGGAFAGASFFYLSTNFAVWALSPWYTHNFAGLLRCYTAALPFFRNALLADILFGSILFFAHEFIRKRAMESPPKTAPVHISR